MKLLMLLMPLVSHAFAPIMDREGHHANWQDFGCPSPMACEEYTGLPAYADAAETIADNVTCNTSAYRCGLDYPLVTLYLGEQ